MNIPSADTPLGDLVTAHPYLASTLDELGLDYCCGGRRSLAEATFERDLDLGDVLADMLAEVASNADGSQRPEWADLGPAEMVDHLEATHHAYLDRALPRLVALAAKVADVHGDRHLELGEVQRLVVELRNDLEPHLRKEEHVLFPMIRELASASAASRSHWASLRDPISVMLLEHDRAGALLAALRAATSDYRVPTNGCASYRALYDGLAELEADTHLHVHKENNLLFPAVVAAEAGVAGRP